MTDLRIALWQCHPTPRDRANNLGRLDTVAAAAARQGAGLLVTPELALTGYDVGPLDDLLVGDEVQQVRAIARRHGLAIVVGCALPADTGRPWNAAVVIDADGEVGATYQKAHLFGDLDSRFASGSAPFAMAQIRGVSVAVMICYDVEFPEAVRAAALAGAHLVAVPTANMHPLQVVNDLVVPTRAWENQVYLAYANHCGRERDTVYVGSSLVASPNGRVLARAVEGEELLVTDIDTAVVEDAQRRNPYLQDRRPEIYR